MVPLGKFLSAFMNGLTKGRSAADHTSHQVSQAYLGHDVLRSFPVPRMTVKDVELELSFAVGASVSLDSLLREPEIVTCILNRIGSDLGQLRGSPAAAQLLGGITVPPARWSFELGVLLASMRRLLTAPPADAATLLHTMAIALANFFHRLREPSADDGLMREVRSFFSADKSAPGAPDSDTAVRHWAAEHAHAALTGALPEGLLETGDDEYGADDLMILVGADLEGTPVHLVHKVKLSFIAEDRKWVSSDNQAGEKVYTLARR